MSNQSRTIYIDRIRLTGLDVTPERAEHIRTLVEAELQQLLERESWPEGVAGGEVSRLNAATMHVSTPHNDNQVAGGIARSVAQSLRGLK